MENNILTVNSLLYIRLTSTSGILTIDNEIPTQTLILKQYSITWDAAGDSTDDVLLLDIQPFTSATINTNVSYKGAIPLLNDKAVRVTNKSIEMPLDSDRSIKKSFEYRIINQSGNAPSNLTSINLLISYNNGVIYR